GAVDSVVYSADVDIARTPEENLAFVEESFARFHAAHLHLPDGQARIGFAGSEMKFDTKFDRCVTDRALK
ncbi:hypothetical protein EVA_14493, partial [gut metagenome]